VGEIDPSGRGSRTRAATVLREECQQLKENVGYNSSFPLLELWRNQKHKKKNQTKKKKKKKNLREGLEAAALRQGPVNRMAIVLARRHPVDLCRCIARDCTGEWKLYTGGNISRGGGYKLYKLRM
jgi:hypothetical protein